jgi:hypothetical protein
LHHVFGAVGSIACGLILCAIATPSTDTTETKDSQADGSGHASNSASQPRKNGKRLIIVEVSYNFVDFLSTHACF